MKKGLCCLALVSLQAAIPTQILGTQYFINSHTLYSRLMGDRFFEPALDRLALPRPRHCSVLSEASWDGYRLALAGATADGRNGVEFATQVRGLANRIVWEHSEPIWLPAPFRLLGSWEGKTLVELTAQRQPESRTGTAPVAKAQAETRVRSLWLVDAFLGQARKIQDVAVPVEPAADASAVMDGKCYLFYGTGLSLAFDFALETVATLQEDFWSSLGLERCLDATYGNPGLDGPAFLDPEGQVILPMRPLLLLTQEDIDLAWSKMPESQRQLLIQNKAYPFRAEQKIGWKAQAGFIAFNPLTQRFRLVDRKQFDHLVQEVDSNFIKTEFVEAVRNRPSPDFLSEGNRIDTMEQGLAEGARHRLATGQGRPDPGDQTALGKRP